jgi:hypothetical protein
MLQQELLSRVIRCLDDLGIDYMLTGSYASSMQGEPRSTHDIDLVVALTMSDSDKLVGAFPDPEFYLLDMAYLEEWAGRLGVSDLWARLKAKAAPI